MVTDGPKIQRKVHRCVTKVESKNRYSTVSFQFSEPKPHIFHLLLPKCIEMTIKNVIIKAEVL